MQTQPESGHVAFLEVLMCLETFNQIQMSCVLPSMHPKNRSGTVSEIWKLTVHGQSTKNSSNEQVTTDEMSPQ